MFFYLAFGSWKRRHEAEVLQVRVLDRPREKGKPGDWQLRGILSYLPNFDHVRAQELNGEHEINSEFKI